MSAELISCGVPLSTQKKKKSKKVNLPKVEKDGIDANGMPIKLISQDFYWVEYTPPPSEEDDYQSATDNEEANSSLQNPVPVGLRRSGRHRSNKLKKANLKNDKLV